MRQCRIAINKTTALREGNPASLGGLVDGLIADAIQERSADELAS
jgi:hypothetical protein